MGMKEVRNLWAYPEVEEFIRVTTTSLNMTHESKAAALASAKTAVPKKGRK